jgi:hypothetical protein
VIAHAQYAMGDKMFLWDIGGSNFLVNLLIISILIKYAYAPQCPIVPHQCLIAGGIEMRDIETNNVAARYEIEEGVSK